MCFSTHFGFSILENGPLENKLTGKDVITIIHKLFNSKEDIFVQVKKVWGSIFMIMKILGGETVKAFR
jgi:hypothetical protein